MLQHQGVHAAAATNVPAPPANALANVGRLGLRTREERMLTSSSETPPTLPSASIELQWLREMVISQCL